MSANYARGVGSKLAKSARLDLGLSVISAVTAEHAPGREWEFVEIADVCDVHHSAIEMIYRRALRKLRLRMSDAVMKDLRAELS